MKTLIKVLFVVLCLGAISCAAAYLYIRKNNQDAARFAAEQAKGSADYRILLRGVEIKAAEDLYAQSLEIEKISYNYSKTLAKGAAMDELVEMRHSLNTLRIMYVRDRTIAQAKEKFSEAQNP